MVNIPGAILHLYPTSEPLRDWAISNTGNGNFISFWSDSLGPQPTEQQLLDAQSSVEITILKKRIASIRYEKESQGIIVGKQAVSTLREEMPIWQGMLLDMTFRPGTTTEFEYKPRNGINVQLSPLQVQRCYECFAWYVSACFATERNLVAAIDAGTPVATIQALADNNATWPQVQFDWIAPE